MQLTQTQVCTKHTFDAQKLLDSQFDLCVLSSHVLCCCAATRIQSKPAKDSSDNLCK